MVELEHEREHESWSETCKLSDIWEPNFFTRIGFNKLNQGKKKLHVVYINMKKLLQLENSWDLSRKIGKFPQRLALYGNEYIDGALTSENKYSAAT